jgi:hypothetical protein
MWGERIFFWKTISTYLTAGSWTREVIALSFPSRDGWLRVHSQDCTVRFCHNRRRAEMRRDHRIGRGKRREDEIILINNRYWWQIVGGNSESGKPTEKCERRTMMKTDPDQMTNFSIFEQLMPTFHSIHFFYLSQSQTYHGNLNVKTSYNAGKCSEVCELHFVRIVRVPQMLSNLWMPQIEGITQISRRIWRDSSILEFDNTSPHSDRHHSRSSDGFLHIETAEASVSLYTFFLFISVTNISR